MATVSPAGSRADYCPIAAGVDVLGDRWTPLVVRELMVGATGFNEIHRGIPRISRTLLAHRLRSLERRGLVAHEASAPGRPGRYVLTPAGEALTPVVRALGRWAAQWQFDDPTGDGDGRAVLWRLAQLASAPDLPLERTVVRLRVTGPRGAEGWLVADRRGITACTSDPGYDVDLLVSADAGAVPRWLTGGASFAALVAAGEVVVTGPRRLVRAFPTWFATAPPAGADSRERSA